MFDGSVPEGRLGVLVAAEANLRTRRDADVELLQLALGWADLHPEESLPPPVDALEGRRRRLAGLVGVRMGGVGTPLVLGHCPAELGAVLETTATGAKHLIGDALDLRDRLPRLWETVQDGAVAAWKARRVATATRALTFEQAAEVDEVVHAVIASLGWTRFEAVLDATIKRADPDGARAAEVQAASQQFVVVGRANDHHIRTLIARGTSLDILSFMAAVNRIADLLAAEGDLDPVDVRRSTAIGVLARPAHALALLARHQPREASPDAAVEGEGEGQDAQEGAGERAGQPDPGQPAEPTSDLAPGGEPDPEGDGYLSCPPTSPLLRDGHRCGCAPRIVLHVHLTDAALTGTDPAAVCRVDGVGPVTVRTVRDWLGRTDASVTVRPVIVPDPPPVDGYEIPQAIRDAVAARHPGSVYPWSNATGPAVDLDHTQSYVPPEQGGPPGQTAVDKLGPLTRREHNTKTFGHLRARQPAPGVHLWRSRHGWMWLVTNTGTHPLGRGPTPDALWRAAAPGSETQSESKSRSPRSPRRPGARPQPRFRSDLTRPSRRAEIPLRT